MTSSESSKINDPFKVLVRVGVSIPLIILIIVVWAYFIIHAAAPLVKNVDSSSTSGFGGTATSHTEINGWDPVASFCDAQVVHDDPGTTTDGLAAQDDLQCESGQVKYYCSDAIGEHIIQTSSIDKVVQYLNQHLSRVDSLGKAIHLRQLITYAQSHHADDPTLDQISSDLNTWVQQGGFTVVQQAEAESQVIDNQLDDFRCLSGKAFDGTKSWCDRSDLSSESVGENISILEEKVRYHCCNDIQYEENINYIGLAIYLVITLPIVYLLIEKILDVFIYRDQPFQKDISNQFKWLGGYISDNGAKLVILVLVFYYLLFPLLRFFFVSYKCEGTNDSTREGNCYNPCTTNDDCRNIPNPRCPVCVNNICSEGNFLDTQTDVRRVGLKVGVCSIRDIIDDLTQPEVDDIANQFKISNNKDAINTYIRTPGSDEEKKVTSYYYKFYPRQELIINDTSEPIRVRIPNPSNVDGTIDGKHYNFRYELNNYLLLERDEDNDIAVTCSDLINDPDDTDRVKEKKCNDKFKCKYTSSQTCEDVTTQCDRYLLPTIQSINDVQDLNDLHLHNKVIRHGIDINAQGELGDNVYPCNDIVIPRVDKVVAKNTIDGNTIDGKTILNDEFDGWITEFELKRVECADKMGQCYMDDYVCETNDGVPIPLKNLEHPLANEYTIGEVSNTGCSNAVYPCEEADLNKRCTSLDVDVNGYLVETPEGGICKEVQWSRGNWVPSFDSNNVFKCIPNKNIDTSSNQPTVKPARQLVPTIEGAKVARWVGTGGNPSTMPTTSCKSVNRITRTTIDNIPVSGISNYFRWYTTDENSDTKLCINKGDLSCGSGKYVNHLGTYQNDMDDSEITDTCCLDEPQDRPVPLIVTMEDATDPQDVSGISPIPLSRRN